MTAFSSNYYVFYADDDPDDLQLVKESFAQYAKSVELVTTKDGHAALEYFRKLKPEDPLPCLIILDINMPGLDGKSLLVRLRLMERLSDTPVVLFTTSTQPIDMIFAKKYKAGFVTKPLNVKQMDLIIDQFIDHCNDDIKKRIRKTSI